MEETKDIILTITLNNNGVKVDGPIRDEMLSFWLLDKAKGIIKISNIQANQPKIHPVGDMIGFARRIFK